MSHASFTPAGRLEGGQRALLRNAPAMPALARTVAGATAARVCQWIDGDPKRDARKCGAPAVPACSWCEAHRRRAFTTDMRAEQQEDA
ncbi:hypothetical protein [Roseomonas indoligenes]|uniref:Uncharacterized protein n=1 Tax=Roseomonas indoligenes TaxID=2820811 RepID=A0A940MRF8_9PROT|nr:hypothetical protein [Pararoseomonas indoligenes]MBP0492109.1 hypothetical protein [Pararoseomonas indoligenes]